MSEVKPKPQMKFTDEQFEAFMTMMKTAPGYVKENVMCYYYYNNGVCSKCPICDTCPSSERKLKR